MHFRNSKFSNISLINIILSTLLLLFSCIKRNYNDNATNNLSKNNIHPLKKSPQNQNSSNSPSTDSSAANNDSIHSEDSTLLKNNQIKITNQLKNSLNNILQDFSQPQISNEQLNKLQSLLKEFKLPVTKIAYLSKDPLQMNTKINTTAYSTFFKYDILIVSLKGWLLNNSKIDQQHLWPKYSQLIVKNNNKVLFKESAKNNTNSLIKGILQYDESVLDVTKLDGSKAPSFTISSNEDNNKKLISSSQRLKLIIIGKSPSLKSLTSYFVVNYYEINSKYFFVYKQLLNSIDELKQTLSTINESAIISKIITQKILPNILIYQKEIKLL